MSKTTTLADIVSSNGTLIVPTGTTAGRPAATAGSIRFNTDLNTLESANGTAWANVGSGAASSGGSISWQPVQNTSFIAVSNKGYGVNTTSGNVVVTLPSTPTVGDQIQLFDYGQTFSANAITLYANGNKIQGNTANIVIQSGGVSVGLVYYDTTKGWVAYSGFPSSPVGNYLIDYLVVAGGGAGGGDSGGGGGAGGLLYGTSVSVTPGTSYPVTVGSGGASSGSTTVNGTNSSFSTFALSFGGGGGGSPRQSAGAPGGSGGGSARDYGGAGGYGSGTAGQGNRGGSSPGTSWASASGGGGAGGVGGNGGSNSPGPDGQVAGAGGVGTSYSISGTPTYYAGGGGGMAYGQPAAAGGTGGGGPGGSSGGGTAGSPNTGGGGGGGSTTTGNGGSGIVIIRYLGNIQKALGGTVTISGGYVIHTFNSSGTFVA